MNTKITAKLGEASGWPPVQGVSALGNKPDTNFILVCGYYLFLFLATGIFFTEIIDFEMINQGDYLRQLYRLGMWHEKETIFYDPKQIGIAMLKFNTNDILYYPWMLLAWLTGANTIAIDSIYWSSLFISFLGACYVSWLLRPLGKMAQFATLVLSTAVYLDPIFVYYKKSCYQENMQFALLLPFIVAIFYEKRLSWLLGLGCLFILAKVQSVVLVPLLGGMLLSAIYHKKYKRSVVFAFMIGVAFLSTINMQHAVNGARINPPNSFFYGLLYNLKDAAIRDKIYADFNLEKNTYMYLENQRNVGIYDARFEKEYFNEFCTKVSLGKIAQYYIVNPDVFLNRFWEMRSHCAENRHLLTYCGSPKDHPVWPSFGAIASKELWLVVVFSVIATTLLILFLKSHSNFWMLMLLSWTPMVVVFLGLVGDGFNEIFKHSLLAFLLIPCYLLIIVLHLLATNTYKLQQG